MKLTWYRNKYITRKDVSEMAKDDGTPFPSLPKFVFLPSYQSYLHQCDNCIATGLCDIDEHHYPDIADLSKASQRKLEEYQRLILEGACACKRCNETCTQGHAIPKYKRI